MKPRLRKDREGLWCVEYTSPQGGVTRYRFQQWAAAIWWANKMAEGK